jgi:hypothetical protein
LLPATVGPVIREEAAVGYKVKIIEDEQLPTGVPWAVVRHDDGRVEAFIKRGSATREVLRRVGDVAWSYLLELRRVDDPAFKSVLPSVPRCDAYALSS